MLTALQTKVLEGIHALSDEIEYNIYESTDIAEYTRLEVVEVKKELHELYENGYLNECMTEEDDGFETFCLSHKAMEAMQL